MGSRLPQRLTWGFRLFRNVTGEPSTLTRLGTTVASALCGFVVGAVGVVGVLAVYAMFTRSSVSGNPSRSVVNLYTAVVFALFLASGVVMVAAAWLLAARWRGVIVAAIAIVLVLFAAGMIYAVPIVSILNECAFDRAFPGGGGGYC